ncbi:hypothetical protein KY363_07760 [Candidatus Woesearchaeota archaeon]|nr:hypothetical protein [Candidatus Woesearchaeota archaeon]
MAKVIVQAERMGESMREIDLYTITREIEPEQMGTLGAFVVELLGERPKNENELNALVQVYCAEMLGGAFGGDPYGIAPDLGRDWRRLSIEDITEDVTIQYRTAMRVGGASGSPEHISNFKDFCFYEHRRRGDALMQYAEWQRGRMEK